MLILASKSAARAALLENAGLTFTRERADIDERAVEAPMVEAGLGAVDLADLLAEAKALDVSSRHPGAYVIGADQTMAFPDENGEEQRFNKPANMEEARRHLLSLSGKTHTLFSSLAVAKDGQTIFRHADRADLTMRDLAPAFIGQYLADIGDLALTSVGSYQLEGPGIQLFREIKGDYFTILGLPLLPLLDFLRGENVIAG